MTATRTRNPLTIGDRKRPTRKHRPAIWENMLGTVYARNDAGEVRYFDYRWDDAIAFSGALDADADPRTYRAERRNWDATNYVAGTYAPRHGQPVLWVRK